MQYSNVRQSADLKMSWFIELTFAQERMNTLSDHRRGHRLQLDNNFPRKNS